MQVDYSWSIAIIAYRETLDVLTRCILAAQRASADKQTIIDVLINGNGMLAQEAAAAAAAWKTSRCQVRIWRIEQGDKAHAWNEYVHRIWTPSTTAFFLDAYAEAQPQAFIELAKALTQPTVLAATGVPSAGRSATRQRETMLREGGLQGSMHALANKTMHQLRTRGFRLPLGLYRTDSLIGAVLVFNFDPAQFRWDATRIAVVVTASWDIDGVTRVTPANIRAKFKRMQRQARGLLENRAVREHLAVRRQLPETLPRTAHELVTKWLETHPKEARSLFLRSPLIYQAARQFKDVRDWSSAALPPKCLTD